MHPLLQALSALVSAIPCFFMAARLARVWKDPASVEGGRWVSMGVGIMILEFVLVHSGTAVGHLGISEGTVARKMAGFAGLGALYLAFAAVISLAFKSRSLLTTFLVVMAGRFVTVVVGISQNDARFLYVQSGAAAILYFFVVFGTLFGPLPRLGLTAEAAEKYRPPGEGTWVDQPHLPIGGGVIYFTLLGLLDLFVFSWIDPQVLLRLNRS